MSTRAPGKSLLPVNDMRWQEHAACVGEDGELFFPLKGGDVGPAMRVCTGCPVRAECLEYALGWGAAGVWGGTTEDERVEMRRARRRTA